MNTSITTRDDIYEATRDLACRMAYLIEHLAQKGLRGKSMQSQVEVLAHSREALEVAPMFLELPDLLIDQIDQLCTQSEELQSFIEARGQQALTEKASEFLQNILLAVPREICELPAEYRVPAGRTGVAANAVRRASAS